MRQLLTGLVCVFVASAAAWAGAPSYTQIIQLDPPDGVSTAGAAGIANNGDVGGNGGSENHEIGMWWTKADGYAVTNISEGSGFSALQPRGLSPGGVMSGRGQDGGWQAWAYDTTNGLRTIGSGEGAGANDSGKMAAEAPARVLLFDGPQFVLSPSDLIAKQINEDDHVVGYGNVGEGYKSWVWRSTGENTWAAAVQLDPPSAPNTHYLAMRMSATGFAGGPVYDEAWGSEHGAIWNVADGSVLADFADPVQAINGSGTAAVGGGSLYLTEDGWQSYDTVDIAAVVQGLQPEWTDISLTGVNDSLEICGYHDTEAGSQPFVLPLGGACSPGDADGDSDVDDDDLSLLLDNWGSETATCAQGEFSDEPPVNDDDLSLLLANWTGPIAAAVPEPVTLAVLGLAAPALLRIRRRA